MGEDPGRTGLKRLNNVTILSIIIFLGAYILSSSGISTSKTTSVPIYSVFYQLLYTANAI